jgi:hypothetical protein
LVEQSITVTAKEQIATGLPDGSFSNQKYQFGYILEGLGMENIGIFMTTWNILQPFGRCYSNLE